ncbi:MAG: hypothetical protein GEU81_06940 [Nitriliruptorales bacterium]|nr:hypothetical protein [Nitriliruptorales bacterium]
MQCQRSSAGRIRLTDQALVAVTLARAGAEASGHPPTVVDLLLGLTEEPDGVVGRLLREQQRGLLELRSRPRSPRTAPLDVTVRWAVPEAAPRAVGTGDLLAAALEVGGAELADALEAAGVHLGADPVARPPRGESPAGCPGLWDNPLSVANETVGLRPPTDPDPALSVEAALAVARTRALAGGAVDLLLTVADGSQRDARATALPDPRTLARAVQRLDARGAPSSGSWDLGLDAVLQAARLWRGGEPVDTTDLVRSALTNGGAGPPAILAESPHPP